MELIQKDKNKHREHALFGTGGNPKSFHDEGYEKTTDMMKWLFEKNLDSYEYQGGRGLKLGKTMIKDIGDRAKEYNITLSIHAPYYISLSSTDEKIRKDSVRHIIQSVEAAEGIGAYLVAVHPGGAAQFSRDDAFKLAYDTLSKVAEEVYKLGSRYTTVKIGLETMGKENQLGTLDEIIEFCKIDKLFCPVVDFGHLYARSLGERFLTCDDYKQVFETIGEKLSDYHAKYLHCHFSKIEYTQKGEKKHLRFENKDFGPEFEPLGKILAEYKLCPNIICESNDTMDIDALFMKKTYFSFFEK